MIILSWPIVNEATTIYLYQVKNEKAQNTTKLKKFLNYIHDYVLH